MRYTLGQYLRRICESLLQEHFDESQFEIRLDGRKRLKWDATPSIFFFRSNRPVRKPPKDRSGDTNFVPCPVWVYLPAMIIVTVDRRPSPLLICLLSCIRRESMSTAENLDHDDIDDSTPTNEQKPEAEARSRIADWESKVIDLSNVNDVLRAENKTIKGQFGKLFTDDQMHAIHRDGEMRGIPWTIETIKKALQIRFACGTAGYQLLRSQHQPLTGIRTLQRYLSNNVDFESGVLCQVLDALSSKVTCMNKEEKFCCITLDEMSVLPSIEYDCSTSHLIGNVNLPNHTGQSTDGLVFMLAGISSRWKQIVAYYFTGNKTDGTAFRPLILRIIQKQQVLDCTSVPLPVTWVAATEQCGQVLVWRQTDISIQLI